MDLTYAHTCVEHTNQISVLVKVAIEEESYPESIRVSTVEKIKAAFMTTSSVDPTLWVDFLRITNSFHESTLVVTACLDLMKDVCLNHPELMNDCFTVLVHLLQNHQSVSVQKLSVQTMITLYTTGIMWILDCSVPMKYALPLWNTFGKLKAVISTVVNPPLVYSMGCRLCVYKLIEEIIVAQSPQIRESWSFPEGLTLGFREGLVTADAFQAESSKFFGDLTRVLFHAEISFPEQTAVLCCLFSIVKKRFTIFPTPFIPVFEFQENLRKTGNAHELRSAEKYILMGLTSVLKSTGCKNLVHQTNQWIAEIKKSLDRLKTVDATIQDKVPEHSNLDKKLRTREKTELKKPPSTTEDIQWKKLNRKTKIASTEKHPDPELQERCSETNSRSEIFDPRKYRKTSSRTVDSEDKDLNSQKVTSLPGPSAVHSFQESCPQTVTTDSIGVAKTVSHQLRTNMAVADDIMPVLSSCVAIVRQNDHLIRRARSQFEQKRSCSRDRKLSILQNPNSGRRTLLPIPRNFVMSGELGSRSLLPTPQSLVTSGRKRVASTERYHFPSNGSGIRPRSPHHPFIRQEMRVDHRDLNGRFSSCYPSNHGHHNADPKMPVYLRLG